jgi:multimeric flavodoxin WrbA
MKITAIVGTYHKTGIIDSAVNAILAAAAEQGAEVNKVYLLDRRIEFCTNCQTCTLEPGPARGKCSIQDDVPGILAAIEASDAFVLASPMNFWTVTALMKAFIERLVCYAYWPWDRMAPKERIERKSKRAIVVASCAAPAIMGRYLTSMNKLLKGAASLLGAGKVDSFFIGLARHTPTAAMSKRARAKAAKLGRKLAR